MRHRASSGFTLIELLVIVAMLFCILVGARTAQSLMGGRYAWLLGGSVGCFSFLLGAAALVLLMDLWTGGLPRLPKCRNGCCRGPGMSRGDGDYDIGRTGEDYHYVCRCGGRYRRRGRRFVIVNDDGTETPYLVWRPFRGWFPDDPDR